MKQNYLFITLTALLVFGCAPKYTNVAIGLRPNTIRINTPDTIRIVAVGDVMMGTENWLPADGGESLFADCIEYIEVADIAFLNLEGPLTDRGYPTKNIELESSVCFRTPPSYVRFLAEAGFNMISLANNHARDYGMEGLNQTTALLDSCDIAWAGPINTFGVKYVGDTSIVMVAFSPYYSSYVIADIPKAQQIVSLLSSEYDIVLVSFHGGREGLGALRLPFNNEYHFGENRGNVVQFSRAVIDAGADIVIGHGPHVPRALEVYKGKLIAYSLGNFCTGIGLMTQGALGYAPLLSFSVDSEGYLLEGEVISFQQSYDRSN